MSKDEKNSMVPELRFPEFLNNGAWEEQTLGKVTYPVSEKNKEGKKHPIYSINNVEGFLPQSEQFDGVDSHSRGYDISLYKVIQKNTFAYNPARINIGSLGYSGELHNIIISSLYVCFKTTKEVEDLYLLHFLKTNGFGQSVKKKVEGGIRSYLFYENFSQVAIHFPPIVEQQKIAACLSSLDEYITAESQQLQALKAHKKGLMHQLFPAEGETVPQLRFAEFRDNGEWRTFPLEEVAQFFSGGTPSKDNPAYWNGTIPWISAASLYNYKIEKSDLCITELAIEEGAQMASKGSLLILVRGSMLYKRIPMGIAIRDVAFNQDVKALKLTNDVDNYFLMFQLIALENKLLNAVTSTGIGAGKLDTTELKQLLILIPSSTEQQKIADCLSSLDALIAAQAEKIEALKLHKKGLMQGLFPQMSEQR